MRTEIAVNDTEASRETIIPACASEETASRKRVRANKRHLRIKSSLADPMFRTKVPWRTHLRVLVVVSVAELRPFCTFFHESTAFGKFALQLGQTYCSPSDQGTEIRYGQGSGKQSWDQPSMK